MIAQEVGAEVPGAVEGGGGVTLASGRQLDTVLRVNKDTLFMGKSIRISAHDFSSTNALLFREYRGSAGAGQGDGQAVPAGGQAAEPRCPHVQAQDQLQHRSKC